MSIVGNLTSLFSKKASKNALSLVFQQSTLAYCYCSYQGIPSLEQLPVVNDDEINALATLHNIESLHATCELILSPKDYQIVQVEKPNVPEQEIAAALKWQVKDLVTIPAEDMSLDYFDGPTVAGMQKVNVVCASTTKLQNYLQAIHKNKLQLSKITIPEFAFSGLLAQSQGPQLLVCQQPGEEIVILIMQNGHLSSYRRLRGMSNIAQRSEDELAMGLIDSLSIEIQKSVDFFERQLKQPPVKLINVLLPIETEAFIARKLSENTHIPVEILSLPKDHPNERGMAVLLGNTAKIQLSHTESITAADNTELPPQTEAAS